MKLFVYEHITSGALIDQDLPASLAHEGDEMLSAVLHDCHCLPTVAVSILRDSRLSKTDNNKRLRCQLVSDPIQFQILWLQCLIDADAIIIIAPETGHVLADLQQQALDHGKTILGCQPSAISITTNKLRCEQQLNNHNIASPKSYLASQWPQQNFEYPDGYIVKPVDGAGCIDTLIFDTAIELKYYLSQQHSEALQHTIVQPYIQGVPASLSLLISDDGILVLAINSQKINRKSNTLIFTGCVVNGIHETLFSLAQATQLAQQIHQSIPGLWGFVGVDIILSNNTATVIDINPRLTTSYVGLQQSLSVNPMELLFSMNEGILPTLDSTLQRKHVNIVI